MYPLRIPGKISEKLGNASGGGGADLWTEKTAGEIYYYDGGAAVGIGDFSAQSIDAPLHIDNSGGNGGIRVYADNTHLITYESDATDKAWSYGGLGGNLTIAEDAATIAFTLYAGGGASFGTASSLPTGVDYLFDGGTVIRNRNSTTRYRSDWSMGGSGGTTFNSYDDTGAVYLPMNIYGLPVRLYVGSGDQSAEFDTTNIILWPTSSVTSNNAFRMTESGGIGYLQWGNSGGSDTLYISQYLSSGNMARLELRASDVRINGTTHVNSTSAPTTTFQVTTGTINDGALIGNAYIGNFSSGGAMKVAYTTLRAVTNAYALYQDGSGITLVNGYGTGGGYVGFRIDNGVKGVLTSDGVWVFGTRGAQGSALGGEGVVEIYGTNSSANEGAKLRFINNSYLFPLVELSGYSADNCWINFGLHYDSGGWQYSTTGHSPWQIYWNTSLLRFYTAPSGTAGNGASRFEVLRFQSDGSTYGRIYLNGSGYISTVSTNNLNLQVNSNTYLYIQNGGPVIIPTGPLRVNQIDDYSGSLVTFGQDISLDANQIRVSIAQGARMSRSNNQGTITSGGVIQAAFNVEDTDTSVGNDLAVSGSNWFYIAFTGWYNISFHVTFSSNSTGRRAVYIKYSSTGAYIAHHIQNATSGTDTMSISTNYYCATGTTITFWVYQDSGSTLTINNNDNYSVEATCVRLA